MKKRLPVLLFVASILSFMLANPPLTNGQRCGGVERWAVKTGSDPDINLVFTPSGRLRSRRTTLQDMIDFPYPFQNPRSMPRAWWTKRVPRYETTVWVLEVTLKEYKLSTDDEDYHVVLEDDSGNTLIAEFANPPCVPEGAPPVISEKIRIAREDFDRKFSGSARATSRMKQAGVRVRIAGIGMFDRAHGQIGRAPNGIELHPVLGIEFLDD